jgi:hypothetical protein
MRGVAPRLHGLPLEHRLSIQCSPLYEGDHGKSTA